MKTGATDYLADQPRLGRTGMVVFLVLLDMFIPLSTDMYLPALPSMSSHFDAPTFVMNLTLSTFFLLYAIGMLLWGPLSDRFGRKRVLLSGVLLYVIGSAVCCVAASVGIMIAARCVQGLGAGAITSVAMAIIKDSYGGETRQKILALVQAVSGLAPMIAPIIGAAILHFFGWRTVFLVLAAIGVCCLILTLLYKESLPAEERTGGGILTSFRHLIAVGANKSLLVPLLTFSILMIPFLGYVSISSYIYEAFFGLSATAYSIFFACNALISLLGPFFYIRVFLRRSKRTFAFLSLGLSVAAGVALLFFGRIAPATFFICFAFFSFAFSANRPFASNMLLDQQEGDTGSASALINFTYAILGFAGMTLLSAAAIDHLVLRLAITVTVISAVSLVSWIALLRSRLPLIGVKDAPPPEG